MPKTEITGYGFFPVCIVKAWLSLLFLIVCWYNLFMKNHSLLLMSHHIEGYSEDHIWLVGL